MIKGQAGFVLPKYENTKYIEIGIGDHFGLIDIVGSINKHEMHADEWISRRNMIKRWFTIIAESDVEVLNLNLADLNRMKLEFFDCYEAMFQEAEVGLRRTMLVKLHAMKHCRKQIKELKKQGFQTFQEANTDGFAIKEIKLEELDEHTLYNGSELFEESSCCESEVASESLTSSEESRDEIR
jgi:hypothetical protein